MATLEALRDRLAAEIDGCSARDLAALSRQLVQVTAELEDLAVPEEASVVDQLAVARANRLSGTDAAGATGTDGKRRRRGS